MSCAAFLVGDGPVRQISPPDAAAYAGGGFIWTHIEGAELDELSQLKGQADIPDVAATALVATETRPRCDRFGDGALVNMRGPAAQVDESSDRLVSIRMWIRHGKVNSVSRRRIAATDTVLKQMEAGLLTDPGDLVAAYARAISTQLDPQVADLGDRLDDCESDFDPKQIYELRRTITEIRSEAIRFRRFVAPDRDALETLAHLDFDWLAEEDRLHIREAADRFARMAEELEAVRERAALLHEQITDMRTEQLDQRSLLISVVAFIFLPLTFISGLLGMNVEGIPYAQEPWAFWGVVAFCALIAAAVAAWFVHRHWLRK